jgi:hypothetical protein
MNNAQEQQLQAGKSECRMLNIWQWVMMMKENPRRRREQPKCLQPGAIRGKRLYIAGNCSCHWTSNAAIALSTSHRPGVHSAKFKIIAPSNAKEMIGKFTNALVQIHELLSSWV